VPKKPRVNPVSIDVTFNVHGFGSNGILDIVVEPKLLTRVCGYVEADTSRKLINLKLFKLAVMSKY
jgi:hypothetical protein